MKKIKHHLLLADDDDDDCTFFKDALDDLPVYTTLDTVSDGEQLMKYLLNNSENLPDVLFLDLNMPRKSGFECLTEIKLMDKLKNLPIIIYSTSLNSEVANLLYDKGALYYIQKPGEFSKLKKVILSAIKLLQHADLKQPSREEFILQP